MVWTDALTTGWAGYITNFMLYIGWWACPILVLFIMKKFMDKYPVDVVIYEKRGNAIIKTNDRAGRFESPIAEYKLKKSKDTIPIPQYDWVLQCMQKPTNFFERIAGMLSGTIGSITIFKYSSKQYKPIKVKMNNQWGFKLRPIVNKNGEQVLINIYQPINPKAALNAIEFEVIDWDDINHMTQELRAIAIRRSPVGDWMAKYGPVASIVLAILALIIAGYYYKDIVTSATPYTPPSQTQQAQSQPAPATQPNIPIISEIIPGT